MESSTQNRRFPPPWRVERASEDCYCVLDANGMTLAAIYCRDDLHRAQCDDYTSHLTSDEARRIATAIARIPEFIIRVPGFYSRQGGDKRWKLSRPYHVALQDSYVREQWDRINAICTYNGVPFDPTGERINRDGLWCVYEFARQIDAMMFWDKFAGRWMRHSDFFYPDPPEDIPVMKEPPNLDKFIPKHRR
jgi:hypothetical protein